MSLIKILKGIKEHWKKSTFAAGVLAYGISYANEKYEINELMRKYCNEAVKYGDTFQEVTVPSKHIVVILNPAANKKSAEKTFQKYCEPILHLSGMIIDVVKTDSEGHARRYVEGLEKLPDAILVAGGDGTLSETITGLMRRSNTDKCAIGILPLGCTNSVAKKVHKFEPQSKGIKEIHELAESTMSVVRGKTEKKDVMKIHVIENEEMNVENATEISKPIFAMGSLQWGIFRDVDALKDKYWYVGPLREYLSTLSNAFNDKLTWNCRVKLRYTPPCPGCSNCFVKEEQKQLSTGRWWSRFIPKFRTQPLQSKEPDYSKVINKNCEVENHVEISPPQIVISANNSSEDNIPKLEVFVENPVNSGFNFIERNWQRIRKNKIDEIKEIEARTIELLPEVTSSDEQEIFYSIDSESYEVRPVKVVLIPRAVELFTS